MLGAADMSADLGAATAWQPLAYARGRLIAACAYPKYRIDCEE
jgi:(S)-citramalyl-CoA lyase